MKERREQRGALALATTESKVVFDGDLLADLRPDEQNRSKEMIQDFMIAANTATAQFLEAKGFPSLRRILKTPERWDRIRSLAKDLGESLPEAASAPALQAFLLKRRAKDPERFPDLSLSVIKLLGSGEYGVEVPGQRDRGPLRPRGEGLRALDGAQPPLPRPRDAAARQGRDRRRAVPLLGRGPRPSWPATAPSRRTTRRRSSARSRSRRRRCCSRPRKGQRFDAIVTGASPKGTWVRVFRPPVEGRVMRGRRGLDVGDRV